MRPRTILAFCCGLFSLGGQALLLAECLATVAGGEIWISSLMGVWFLSGRHRIAGGTPNPLGSIAVD